MQTDIKNGQVVVEKYYSYRSLSLLPTDVVYPWIRCVTDDESTCTTKGQALSEPNH